MTTQINNNMLAFDGGAFGFRNKLINGGFDIWQRATASVALTNTSGTYATADRWAAHQDTSAAGTWQQNTSVPSGVGLRYSMRIGRNNGSAVTNPIRMSQVIETANATSLQGQTVTFSVYLKAGANFSAASNAVYLYIVEGTGSDQGVASGMPPSSAWTGSIQNYTTKTITSSWVRYSYTVTLNAATTELGVQIAYVPSGTAGADDNLFISGAQLEAGSVATPFEFRPFGLELALCQRYYEKSYPLATAVPTNGTLQGFANAVPNKTLTGAATNERVADIRFNVAKRAAPTITFYTLTSSTAGSWEDGGGTARAMATNGITEFGFSAYNNANVATNTNLSGHWVAEKEL